MSPEWARNKTSSQKTNIYTNAHVSSVIYSKAKLIIKHKLFQKHRKNTFNKYTNTLKMYATVKLI